MATTRYTRSVLTRSMRYGTVASMRRVCMVVVAAVCAIGAGCAYNANLTLTGSFAGTASDSTTV